MNRYAFAAGAAALSLLLAACGSSNTTTPAAPATSSSSSSSSDMGSGSGSGGVVIKDFKFGGTLTAKAGEKVKVKNDDTAGHSMTSKTAGQFDTGKIDPSGSGEFTAPATAGSYDVICTFHPKMAGKLTVA